MLEKVIIVKYGEIGLKGKNRYYFENILVGNIKKRLSDYDIKVFKTHGRIYVENVDENLDEITTLLKEIFGIGLYNLIGDKGHPPGQGGCNRGF